MEKIPKLSNPVDQELKDGASPPQSKPADRPKPRRVWENTAESFAKWKESGGDPSATEEDYEGFLIKTYGDLGEGSPEQEGTKIASNKTPISPSQPSGKQIRKKRVDLEEAMGVLQEGLAGSPDMPPHEATKIRDDIGLARGYIKAIQKYSEVDWTEALARISELEELIGKEKLSTEELGAFRKREKFLRAVADQITEGITEKFAGGHKGPAPDVEPQANPSPDKTPDQNGELEKVALQILEEKRAKFIEANKKKLQVDQESSLIKRGAKKLGRGATWVFRKGERKEIKEAETSYKSAEAAWIASQFRERLTTKKEKLESLKGWERLQTEKNLEFQALIEAQKEEADRLNKELIDKFPSRERAMMKRTQEIFRKFNPSQKPSLGRRIGTAAVLSTAGATVGAGVAFLISGPLSLMYLGGRVVGGTAGILGAAAWGENYTKRRGEKFSKENADPKMEEISKLLQKGNIVEAHKKHEELLAQKKKFEKKTLYGKLLRMGATGAGVSGLAGAFFEFYNPAAAAMPDSPNRPLNQGLGRRALEEAVENRRNAVAPSPDGEPIERRRGVGRRSLENRAERATEERTLAETNPTLGHEEGLGRSRGVIEEGVGARGETPNLSLGHEIDAGERTPNLSLGHETELGETRRVLEERAERLAEPEPGENYNRDNNPLGTPVVNPELSNPTPGDNFAYGDPSLTRPYPGDDFAYDNRPTPNPENLTLGHERPEGPGLSLGIEDAPERPEPLTPEQEYERAQGRAGGVQGQEGRYFGGRETVQYSNIIEPGGDSVWKSTREILIKNHTELGYTGEPNNAKAIKAWAENRTRELFEQNPNMKALDKIPPGGAVTLTVNPEGAFSIDYTSPDAKPKVAGDIPQKKVVAPIEKPTNKVNPIEVAPTVNANEVLNKALDKRFGTESFFFGNHAGNNSEIWMQTQNKPAKLIFETNYIDEAGAKNQFGVNKAQLSSMRDWLGSLQKESGLQPEEVRGLRGKMRMETVEEFAKRALVKIAGGAR